MVSSSASEVQMPSSTGSRTRVEIGRVVRPHALKGALLVQLYGDDPGNLSGAESVVLSGKSGETELRLLRSAHVDRWDVAVSRRAAVRIRRCSST